MILTIMSCTRCPRRILNEGGELGGWRLLRRMGGTDQDDECFALALLCDMISEFADKNDGVDIARTPVS